ncbi:Heterochromatin protein 1 [Cucumispora dikerogammari]|nr:Heterochromatin protein 1 [Cucumispora dikerogammari]
MVDKSKTVKKKLKKKPLNLYPSSLKSKSNIKSNSINNTHKIDNNNNSSSSYEEEEHYLVEKIIEMRVNKITKKKEYLIKWLHYPESENTWEPEENLSVSLLKEYNRTHKSKADEKRSIKGNEYHNLIEKIVDIKRIEKPSEKFFSSRKDNNSSNSSNSRQIVVVKLRGKQSNMSFSFEKAKKLFPIRLLRFYLSKITNL